MADSTFWRELAVQFRDLPRKYGDLQGDRTVVIDEPVGEWHLRGSRTARVEFEALARRGAMHIPNPRSPDLLTAWLEGLAYDEKGTGTMFGTTRERNGPTIHTAHSLFNLPERSANYCKFLESEALEVEANQTRRNDPKNWPPLRAEYEVFKKLRDLTSGPHERIPEALVRDAISRRLGVKPEEITLKQIQHEVSGLLPYYQAITLVPQPKLEPHSNFRRKRKHKSRRIHKETIPEQIQRLRVECKWSIEDLAAKTGFDERTVRRHLAGDATPHLRNLTTYQQAFSKALKREVVISKMP